MSDGWSVTTKFILRDVDADGLILAARAAKYGLTMEGRDAILTFGEGERPVATFYIKRNKSSITVRKIADV